MTDTIIVDVSIRGKCDELAAAGYLAGMKGLPLAPESEALRLTEIVRTN